jgi:hypothetical protein
LVRRCSGAAMKMVSLPLRSWARSSHALQPLCKCGRRPPLAETAGSSVAARTPSSSLMAIRGAESDWLKATFRDEHHILWCRAVLILTRNLGGSNAKTVSFWICRRSNRLGHDCLGRSQYRHTPSSRPCSAKGGAGAVRTHPEPTLPGITTGLLIGLSGTKLPS